MKNRMLLVSFLLFLFIIVPSIDSSENLLKNPSFENEISDWSSYPSTAIFTATNSAKVGTVSAILTKSTSSYAYFFQRLPVEASTFYQTSGYVLLNDSKINNLKLRINYLDDKETKINSFEAITSDNKPEWQYLTSIPIESPSNAFFAEVQGYIYLTEKNPTIPALFDELSFFKVDATPSPTLIPIKLTPTNSTISPSPTTTPTLIQPTMTNSTISPTPAYSYENVFLSEVMANPEAGEKEWIEVFNNNNFEVSLIDWQIDDKENTGSAIKKFSLTIPARSYGTYDLVSSMFNNDGDTVRLLDSNSNIKDGFEYGQSEKNKTLGRINLEDDTFCTQEPSKNKENNLCINDNSTPEPVASTTKIPTVQKKIEKKITPSVIIQVKNNHSSLTKKPALLKTTNQKINPTIGQILGTNNFVDNSQKKYDLSLLKSLSFISFSYSLLTIISILFRMNKYAPL